MTLLIFQLDIILNSAWKNKFEVVDLFFIIRVLVNAIKTRIFRNLKVKNFENCHSETRTFS